ncbi:type II toxin-antitoxin system antitoxin SocA domain-containing protein [Sinorhizobium sp. Sb3]|uniref:Panacea domain-containing protein n=1 Tax=Sinorhizobium sp. Sb3 TaxID=1358417 RepID=UPI0009E9C678|nr:type II toxin-antitoxin system antitoxin SocA domain-containing protein [Sinorhizobium sp. Sb3]
MSELAARLDSVCKYICERADWEITNLQLQKILYLCQMFYMGRNHGQRLFDGHFEAWDYGPVEPNLYHRVKIFGSDDVEDVFHRARTFRRDDPRRKVMDDVCDKFLKFSAGDLVEITHWDEGAWAEHYTPGARGVRIPDEDIWAEYDRRQDRARRNRKRS